MLNAVSIKRLVLASLVSYGVIAVLFFLLTAFRMSYMPGAAQLICGDDPSTMSFCVAELTKYMLFGAQWSAVKFTVYVFALTPLLWLFYRRTGFDVGINLLALFLSVMAILVLSIKPPWVEIAALLTTCLLVGAFILRRFRNGHRVNN